MNVENELAAANSLIVTYEAQIERLKGEAATAESVGKDCLNEMDEWRTKAAKLEAQLAAITAERNELAVIVAGQEIQAVLDKRGVQIGTTANIQLNHR